MLEKEPKPGGCSCNGCGAALCWCSFMNRPGELQLAVLSNSWPAACRLAQHRLLACPTILEPPLQAPSPAAPPAKTACCCLAHGSKTSAVC